MCGVRHWHLETYRYGDDALEEHFAHRAAPRAAQLGPTGLGTSAARVLTTLTGALRQ
jgi:germacradienol/geosmin synthase